MVSTTDRFDAAPLLSRALDEERHRGDLVDVAAVHVAPVELALLEGDAVVGEHHDQGVVVDALALEAPERLPQLPVGEARLEQMAELKLVDLALVLVALPGDLRDRLLRARPVLPPVRQVQPRHVREQRVLEVQRGAAALRRDLRDPVLEARVAIAREVRARVRLVAVAGGGGRVATGVAAPGPAAEVSPGLRDRRQVPLDAGRGHHVRVHQPEVLGHRAEPLHERLVEARVLAQVAGAYARRLLGHVHRVALAEQREDAVRVLRRGGEALLLHRQVCRP